VCLAEVQPFPNPGRKVDPQKGTQKSSRGGKSRRMNTCLLARGGSGVKNFSFGETQHRGDPKGVSKWNVSRAETGQGGEWQC